MKVKESNAKIVVEFNGVRECDAFICLLRNVNTAKTSSGADNLRDQILDGIEDGTPKMKKVKKNTKPEIGFERRL